MRSWAPGATTAVVQPVLFFSSRRRHTRCLSDWSSDVCSSDLRVFRLPELRRLAARFNLPVSPASEVCVARPVSPPDPALFLAAMRKELPQAAIEIEDYSRQPLPAGDLTFPAAS